MNAVRSRSTVDEVGVRPHVQQLDEARRQHDNAELLQRWPGSNTSRRIDLLVGQNTDSGLHGPKDFRALKPKGGASQAFSVNAQWVFPTGGAYLFAPSLGAIRSWMVSP